MICVGDPRLEVEGIDVGREHRDVARAEIVQRSLGVLQPGEAEERRGCGADRHLDRAKTLLDLFLDLRFGQLLAVEMRVRPGVGADGVAGGGNLLEDFRMIGRVLADREEHRLGAFLGQRLQHRRRGRPRAVVEGQHDFLLGQEVELLVLLEAEARSARGVDDDGAADAERIGIGASGFCGTGAAGGSARSRLRSAAVTSTSSLAAAWRRRRQRLGLAGGDGLRGGRIGARRGGPEPNSGDHDRRNNTGQHQAERITHRYTFHYITQRAINATGLNAPQRRPSVIFSAPRRSVA